MNSSELTKAEVRDVLIKEGIIPRSSFVITASRDRGIPEIICVSCIRLRFVAVHHRLPQETTVELSRLTQMPGLQMTIVIPNFHDARASSQIQEEV